MQKVDFNTIRMYYRQEKSEDRQDFWEIQFSIGPDILLYPENYMTKEENDAYKMIFHKVIFEFIDIYCKGRVVEYKMNWRCDKQPKRKWWLFGAWGEGDFSKTDKPAILTNELSKIDFDGFYDYYTDEGIDYMGFYPYFKYLRRTFCIYHHKFDKDFYLPLLPQTVPQPDTLNTIKIFNESNIEYKADNYSTIKHYLQKDNVCSIQLVDNYTYIMINMRKDFCDIGELSDILIKLFAKYGKNLELPDGEIFWQRQDELARNFGNQILWGFAIGILALLGSLVYIWLF